MLFVWRVWIVVGRERREGVGESGKSWFGGREEGGVPWEEGWWWKVSVSHLERRVAVGLGLVMVMGLGLRREVSSFSVSTASGGGVGGWLRKAQKPGAWVGERRRRRRRAKMDVVRRRRRAGDGLVSADVEGVLHEE